MFRAPLSWQRALAVVVSAGLLAVPVAEPSAASAKVSPNTHFALGRGDLPNLAIGKDGTAYVAWVHQGSPGVEDEIQFCRVPRGKRSCSGALTFTLPGQQTGQRPYVFLPDAHTVLILTYRCCFNATEAPYGEENLLLRSTDGGKTFAPPVLVGTHSAKGDAQLGPDGTVYTASDVETFGVTVQRGNLAGSAVPQPAQAALLGPASQPDEYGGSLAVLDDGSVLATHYDERDNVDTMRVSRYAGTGDPNVDASWSTVFSGPGSSPTSGELAQLASGKRGVYLFNVDHEVFARFQLRKWTGSAFAAPVFLTPKGQDNIFPTFWQDAAGRLSLAYSNNDRVITYRASDRSGFASAVALRATDAYDLRGATAADGGGFVAYDSNSGSGTVSLVPIPTKRVITETVKGGKVSGKVAVGLLHQPVVLQKKAGKGWVTVTATKLTAAGKYAFTIPAGKATWRAVASAVEGYAEADGKPFARG